MISHSVCHPISMVCSHNTKTKEIFKSIQQLDIAFVLYNGELRKNLKTSCHFIVSINSDMKTTFTIDKPCYPFCIKFHLPTPNVKSLRVPILLWAFPADCPRVW